MALMETTTAGDARRKRCGLLRLHPIVGKRAWLALGLVGAGLEAFALLKGDPRFPPLFHSPKAWQGTPARRI